MQINATYGELGITVWKKFKILHQLDSYSGILSMYAAARLAKIILQSGENQSALDLSGEVAALLRPYWQGQKQFTSGMFGRHIYSVGGQAAAWQFCRGLEPESGPVLVTAAERLLALQSRSPEGVFDNPDHPEHGYITCDTLSAVCPFLVWIGHGAGRRDFLDEAAAQFLAHYDRLFDRRSGLFHQAYIPGETPPPGNNRHELNQLGALCRPAKPGLIDAMWSRGNGYVAFALAELIYDLPKDHPDYHRILEIWRNLLEAFINYQDQDGMWHQVMDDFGSYPETSGSALILYALGRGIKNKSIDRDRFVKPYRRGLAAMMRFVSRDGSIYHCCRESFCPGGRGTRADYALWPWRRNDPRGFAPVMLMLGQANQVEQRTGLIPPLHEL